MTGKLREAQMTRTISDMPADHDDLQMGICEPGLR